MISVRDEADEPLDALIGPGEPLAPLLHLVVQRLRVVAQVLGDLLPDVRDAGRGDEVLAVICPRLGAAVDLFVPGIPALEIGRWVASKTSFDRIYLYGDDRPLYVSHGPENSRLVVEMVARLSGRRTPRVLRW